MRVFRRRGAFSGVRLLVGLEGWLLLFFSFSVRYVLPLVLDGAEKGSGDANCVARSRDAILVWLAPAVCAVVCCGAWSWWTYLHEHYLHPCPMAGMSPTLPQPL